jgi:hypothetical protein
MIAYDSLDWYKSIAVIRMIVVGGRNSISRVHHGTISSHENIQITLL